MLHRSGALVLTLTLTMAFVSLPRAARAQSTQPTLPWQRTDSQHFEIHYLPALAPELDRVVRSAERAYERIAGQLNFVMPARVPLVVTPSGLMTRAEIRAYAHSAQVAPGTPRSTT